VPALNLIYSSRTLGLRMTTGVGRGWVSIGETWHEIGRTNTDIEAQLRKRYRGTGHLRPRVRS
jgi:hypothetical protein